MAVESTTPQQNIEPKIEKVTEELMTKLNDVEWNNRAAELAEAHTKVGEIEIHRKNVMADMAADLKTAKARETKLANTVATRSELREVTVEVKYDYDLGFVIKTRTDNHEEISRREMTTRERQAGFFDDEADEGEDGVTDANDMIHAVHEENKSTNTRAASNSKPINQ